jgi:glycosyltransferase involved in cell wall biosynthesis
MDYGVGVRVWVLTVGEPPLDDGSRPLRSGLLARRLAERGHEVTWWTSAFDHSTKSFRTVTNDATSFERGVQVRQIKGTGYQKNVGLARLIDQLCLAVRFRVASSREALPDVVLCSLPIIDLAVSFLSLRGASKVPLVVDCRDMWPDIFVDSAPRQLRKLFRAFLHPYVRVTRFALNRSTAIVGHTDEFVRWGSAQKKARGLEMTFPFGYPKPAVNRPWELLERDGTLRFVFIGAISHRSYLLWLVEEFNQMQDLPVELIVCGSGPFLEELRTKSSSRSISFLGWLDQEGLASQMARCDIGVVPYYSTKDFVASIPNKVPEYLSHGLYVVSTIDTGVLSEFLSATETGEAISHTEGAMRHVAEKCLRNADQISSLRDKRFSVFLETFEESKVYSNFSDFLENVANSPLVP